MLDDFEFFARFQLRQVLIGIVFHQIHTALCLAPT